MSQRTDDAGSILLIEDDRAMADTVGEYLERVGFQVDRAHDAEQGLRRAAGGGHDVLVLDLDQPGADSAELCRELRDAAPPAAALLVLTARGENEAPAPVGADDQLAKPFALQQLEERIRALVRREARQVDAEVLQVGDLVFDTATQRVHRGGRELQLSPIGMKLLTILMRESPRVVGRGEIEREIWGDALPDSDTLRSHLYNLRKAIDKPFERPLLQTIHSAGYRLAELEREPSARSA